MFFSSSPLVFTRGRFVAAMWMEAVIIGRWTRACAGTRQNLPEALWWCLVDCH